MNLKPPCPRVGDDAIAADQMFTTLMGDQVNHDALFFQRAVGGNLDI
jgi:hypothetical protein